MLGAWGSVRLHSLVPGKVWRVLLYVSYLAPPIFKMIFSLELSICEGDASPHRLLSSVKKRRTQIKRSKASFGAGRFSRVPHSSAFKAHFVPATCISYRQEGTSAISYHVQCLFPDSAPWPYCLSTFQEMHQTK